MAHKIFLKFYMKIERFKEQNLTELNFSENSFLEKNSKSVMDISVTYDCTKIAYLGKFWFVSYEVNALNQSDDSIIWKERKGINWYLRFLLGDNNERKVGSKTATYGWVWSVVLFDQTDCRVLWSPISCERIN